MEIITYTVRPGNTLWAIANFFGTTVEDIAGLNDIRYPYTIYPGQEIKILASRIGVPAYYTVRPGDTIWNISQRYGIDIKTILGYNNLENPNAIYPGQIIRLS